MSWNCEQIFKKWFITSICYICSFKCIIGLWEQKISITFSQISALFKNDNSGKFEWGTQWIWVELLRTEYSHNASPHEKKYTGCVELSQNISLLLLPEDTVSIEIVSSVRYTNALWSCIPGLQQRETLGHRAELSCEQKWNVKWLEPRSFSQDCRISLRAGRAALGNPVSTIIEVLQKIGKRFDTDFSNQHFNPNSCSVLME